jgi:predicted CopG family antitoxin
LTPPPLSVHAKCMAVKTVTIDMEAYDLLSRHKREGQSFSQVIKEHFSGAKKGRDLMAVLREVSLSEEALDAVEAQVKGREAHRAKAPEL